MQSAANAMQLAASSKNTVPSAAPASQPNTTVRRTPQDSPAPQPQAVAPQTPANQTPAPQPKAPPVPQPVVQAAPTTYYNKSYKNNDPK